MCWICSFYFELNTWDILFIFRTNNSLDKSESKSVYSLILEVLP